MKSRIEKFIDTLDDDDTIESINEKARNVFFEAEKEKCEHIIAYVTCSAESRNGFTTAENFKYIKENFEIEEFEFLDFCPKCGKKNAQYNTKRDADAALRLKETISDAINEFEQQTGVKVFGIDTSVRSKLAGIRNKVKIQYDSDDVQRIVSKVFDIDKDFKLSKHYRHEGWWNGG